MQKVPALSISDDAVVGVLDDLAERGSTPARDEALRYARVRYGASLTRYLSAIETVGLDGCAQVLDIGCGVGPWSVALAARNHHVLGVDIRPEYVEVARTIASRTDVADRVSFETGEAEELDQPAASVDAIFCHMVLMWVPEPELALAEFSRCLRPSGALYVAYTTDAMLLRGIAGAGRVGWERARLPAINLLSSALYSAGCYQSFGSRIRSYNPGALERLGGLFGLSIESSPHVEDGPHEWLGRPATGDFLARKLAGPDGIERAVLDADANDAVDALKDIVRIGAPRAALRMLDRVAVADRDGANGVRLAAYLKLGDLDAAAAVVDAATDEGPDLIGLYHFQRGDYATAADKLTSVPEPDKRAFLLACALLAGGKPGPAGELFREVLDADAMHAPAIAGAVLAALAEDNHDEVASVVASVESRSSASATVPDSEWVAAAVTSAINSVEELSQTSEPLKLEDLGLADPDLMPYQVTNRRLIPLIFGNIDVSINDVFVDFGCGKGRILLAAASHPFGRVVGIDISDDLCAVARQNIEHNRDRLSCKNVEVLSVSATSFVVPDDMTVAYMYNPFKGEAFTRAMANIVASLDRRPRKVTLIYLLPTMDDAVRGTGRFEVVRRERFGDADGQEIVFYESRPQDNPPMSTGGQAADAPELPVHVLEIGQGEFSRLHPQARNLFRNAARRLEANEFFARDDPPPKEWAFVDLNEYENFEAFLRACRKIHSGNAVRDARKAAERGYYGHFFDPRTFVGDTAAIDSSAPERQGGPMADHYMRSVEERGGYPEQYWPEARPDQAMVWDRHFGVFQQEPGHTQGEIVVDERLLSYLKLRRLGPFSFYGTILGHADHLREGVMYKMHLDLVEHLLRNRQLLSDADPGADPSLDGLRFIGYARFFGVGKGLGMWKKRMLFEPGYFLLRYPEEQ